MRPDPPPSVTGDAHPGVAWGCDILTLFPDFFVSPLATSIVQRAQDKGALAVRVHNIRDHTTDRHRSADDTPYGGGAGMVMKPEPLVACIEAVEAAHGATHRVLLTPQGRPFTQRVAEQLAGHDRLMLVCGRYEGVDERVRAHFVHDEVSIGDYVLTGGEPAALVLLDAVIRLRPGVLGNAESICEESFTSGLLEYPQYTRPHTFRGYAVPGVLTSGNHGRVARWRREQSLTRTLQRRPDLLAAARASLSEEDRAFLVGLDAESLQSLAALAMTTAAERSGLPLASSSEPESGPVHNPDPTQASSSES